MMNIKMISHRGHKGLSLTETQRTQRNYNLLKNKDIDLSQKLPLAGQATCDELSRVEDIGNIKKMISHRGTACDELSRVEDTEFK